MLLAFRSRYGIFCCYFNIKNTILTINSKKSGIIYILRNVIRTNCWCILPARPLGFTSASSRMDFGREFMMELQEKETQPGWNGLYDPWNSELPSFLLFSSATSSLNTRYYKKSLKYHLTGTRAVRKKFNSVKRIFGKGDLFVIVWLIID